MVTVFLISTYKFNHFSFLHWRDPATDDTGAEAAQLDEVVSEWMIQSPGKTVTVHNKLEFLLTESEEKTRRFRPVSRGQFNKKKFNAHIFYWCKNTENYILAFKMPVFGNKYWATCYQFTHFWWPRGIKTHFPYPLSLCRWARHPSASQLIWETLQFLGLCLLVWFSVKLNTVDIWKPD